MAIWDPKTYQEAVALVHNTRNEPLAAVLNVKGAMSCPAPSWDPHRAYRVALAGGTPTLQMLVNGEWVLAPLEQPNQPLPASAVSTEFDTKTTNILFMDVNGWSGLQASQIHDYVVKAMPKLAEHLKDDDFRNTWGDAIVATFDSAKKAAEAALNIRDFFKRAYVSDGVPSGLSCRVSLHCGEAIIDYNALTKHRDIFGQGVHVAARLEPATSPGHVFCTKSFADRLDEVKGAAPKAWPLGRILLPKNFGEIETFVVTWPNDDAPVPSIVLKTPSPKRKTSSPKDEVPPAAETLSEADVKIALKAWLSSLPVGKSGTAFKFANIDDELELPPGSSKRFLATIVRQRDGSWKVKEEGDMMISLTFEHPAAIVVSRPRSRRID
jgi:class 3 adenylate cyclase